MTPAKCSFKTAAEVRKAIDKDKCMVVPHKQKPGRKESEVWKLFNDIRDANTKLKKWACCKECEQVVNSSTTTMARHLASKTNKKHTQPIQEKFRKIIHERKETAKENAKRDQIKRKSRMDSASENTSFRKISEKDCDELRAVMKAKCLDAINKDY